MRKAAVAKLFQENGFTMTRAKNHPIWRCPCGHAQIVIAGSGGKGRGDTNAKLQIRRTLRACATHQEEAAA